MTPEVNEALLQSLNVAGLKPRDTMKILETLKGEFGVEASIEDGLLTLKQGETEMNPTRAFKTYVAKHPQDFYGVDPAEIRYKSDLETTTQKMAYVNKFGARAWENLPYNENSPAAKTVVGPAIAHAGMTAAQYRTLSVAEKTKLAGTVGWQGVGEILNRK